MKPVELICDHDCPNIKQARTHLLRAFSEAGVYAEWDRGDSSSPSHVRSYGSPTVLVNGKDVAGAAPSENIACCHLYADANGDFNGAPSVEMIATALRNFQEEPTSDGADKGRTGWLNSLAVLPGIVASLIPVGVCPAC